MVKELNERFGIPNALHFELDQHGMERAVINCPFATGTIYLQGAHVTDYTPYNKRPVLFLSSKSSFTPDKAIRGGIPVIFPWFGPKRDDPAAPMHGFARTANWQVEHTETSAHTVSMTLSLPPYLKLHVFFGPWLSVRMSVENHSPSLITFEAALHTYLSVSNVSEVFIDGLQGKTYIDKTDKMQRKIEGDDYLRITSETDRVYLSTEDDLFVNDPVWSRQIMIVKRGSATTVIWNPWNEKAAKMSDMGAEEWKQMVCVETANAMDNAITLAPGQTHEMTTLVVAESFEVISELTSAQSPSSPPP